MFHSYYNITHPANTMTAMVSGTIGAIGVPGNLLLICFIMCDYQKRKPHEWLLFVLAVGDLIFCLNNATLQAPFILDFENVACKVAGAIDYMFGMVSFFTPPVVMYNRYLALYDSQKCVKIFTTPKVFLIWFIILTYGFGCVAPFVWFGSLGRDDIGICGIQVTNPILIGMMILICVTCVSITGISAFLCYKVVKKIRNHQQDRSHLQSQLIEKSKELIIVMIALAALPLICEVPSATVKLLQSFLPEFNIWIGHILISLFPLTPASNAYITMYVVTDYRRMVLRCFRRITTIKDPRVGPLITNPAADSRGTGYVHAV